MAPPSGQQRPLLGCAVRAREEGSELVAGAGPGQESERTALLWEVNAHPGLYFQFSSSCFLLFSLGVLSCWDEEIINRGSAAHEVLKLLERVRVSSAFTHNNVPIPLCVSLSPSFTLCVSASVSLSLCMLKFTPSAKTSAFPQQNKLLISKSTNYREKTQIEDGHYRSCCFSYIFCMIFTCAVMKS